MKPNVTEEINRIRLEKGCLESDLQNFNYKLSGIKKALIKALKINNLLDWLSKLKSKS